jgi:para-aminobenzoate synthetase/4-amino-4-deoxychorismate lyase
MKGTIRRGRWLEEDADAKARLAASAKDRAENLMIVDLLRNDLGRVAEYGTVDVRELFAIESYPTVHQMTSTITAKLRDATSIGDVFAATFPCGSITGAPKIAAMQMIAELETEPRGPYCGAIGVLRPDGSATFNVAIRTVVIDRTAHSATYGAGGGITWDSHAEAEYDEVLAKAALLDEPIPSFDLLETMRLDDGVIRRLTLHLSRLRASARFFGWPDVTGDTAETALHALCDDVPSGSWRIRLTVSRTGACALERAPLAAPLADTQTVAIATKPVSTENLLLFHKTTARDVYASHQAAHPDAYDVLLLNEHGFITEFTNGNVVLEIDNALLTPRREHGLLAGTFRAELLDNGTIREADLRVEDVHRASRAWLINSVREWVEVRL